MVVSTSLASNELWTGVGLPLVVLLAKTTLVLLVAFGVTRCMHHSSASARHRVWLTMLVALMIAPVLSAWTPLPLRVLPAPGTPETVGPLVAPRAPAAPQAIGGSDRGTLDPAAGTRPPTRSPGLALPSRAAFGISLPFAVWASAALGLLASLFRSVFVVRRIVRRSQPLGAEEWLSPLWETCDRLGLDEPPRLLRSAEAAMPFACGLLKPTVVLPQGCESWSLERRRAVLLHELAHVRRGDLVSHLLARVVCAVYWFHPLVWKAARQLRSESELACDDVVVQCGMPAADYAEHLLEIVTTARRGAAPSAALAMARRTEFEGRILSILDPELRRTSPSRPQTVLLLAALLIISLGVGAARPVPREAPLAQRETTSLLAASSLTAETSTAAGRAGLGVGPGSTATDVPNTVPQSDTTDRAVDPSARQVPSGTPLLLSRVLRSDTSARLRRTAAWGLREHVVTPAAIEALSHALRRDADASVREMAAWSLAYPGRGSSQAAALVAALRGDRDVRVRATAAWALGTLADPALSDAVATALSDPRVEVRTRAAWALGSSKPREAPRALLALLRDRDAKVRELAAWALHRIGDRSAVPPLEAALEDEREGKVRLALIRARASLGEPFGGVFLDLLQSSDSSVRATVTSALAGQGAGHWHWHWHDTRPSP